MDYDKFHQDIATQVELTQTQVQSIRTSYFDNGEDKSVVMGKLAEKIQQPRRSHGGTKVGKRTRSKEYYQTLLDYLTSCPEDQFKIITQTAIVS